MNKKYFLEPAVYGTVTYAISVLSLELEALHQQTPMPRQSDDFGLLEPGAAAKVRLTRKQMLRDWDAVRAALPEVDAQFIRETRENLSSVRSFMHNLRANSALEYEIFCA